MHGDYNYITQKTDSKNSKKFKNSYLKELKLVVCKN